MIANLQRVNIINGALKKMSDSEVKVLESKVTDFKDLEFKNDNNPLAKNFDINFKDMTADFVFQGDMYIMRLPDKRLINKFKKMQQMGLDKQDKLKKNPKLVREIEVLQDKIIEDMIIDFKLSKYRMDDLEYMQLTSLCWDFYVFLQERLAERGRDYSSSLRAS